ncbi:MAG: polyprenyl synthetase family protein, partial [Oscillospiraceae bacterium]
LLDGTDSMACLSAIKALSNYAGVDGMVGGQVIDLINEGKIIDENTLYKTHKLKTSALICSAIKLGMLAANASKEETEHAVSFGYELGMAFQIIDDILDVVGDEKALGKPIGSDASNEKTTFVSLYTLEGAKRRASEHTNRALEFLSQTKYSEFLVELTNSLLTRMN